MVTVTTCVVLRCSIYTLYSLDEELTDKYTTNFCNPDHDLLTDTLIGRWLARGATTLHRNLAMQTLTFPQLLHQLGILENQGNQAQWEREFEVGLSLQC